MDHLIEKHIKLEKWWLEWDATSEFLYVCGFSLNENMEYLPYETGPVETTYGPKLVETFNKSVYLLGKSTSLQRRWRIPSELIPKFRNGFTEDWVSCFYSARQNSPEHAAPPKDNEVVTKKKKRKTTDTEPNRTVETSEEEISEKKIYTLKECRVKLDRVKLPLIVKKQFKINAANETISRKRKRTENGSSTDKLVKSNKRLDSAQVRNSSTDSRDQSTKGRLNSISEFELTQSDNSQINADISPVRKVHKDSKIKHKKGAKEKKKKKSQSSLRAVSTRPNSPVQEEYHSPDISISSIGGFTTPGGMSQLGATSTGFQTPIHVKEASLKCQSYTPMLKVQKVMTRAKRSTRTLVPKKILSQKSSPKVKTTALDHIEVPVHSHTEPVYYE